MGIITMNRASRSKMDVKWFKVVFDPNDWRTPRNMFEFSDYVTERRVFNVDDRQIDYWGLTYPTNESFYERILKTNSKIYFDELNAKYRLVEIEKPEEIVDRQTKDEMILILNYARSNNTLVKVEPMRNPYFGVFTAKVDRYDEAGALFKKSDASVGFPDCQKSVDVVYLNLFRLTNLESQK